MKYGAAWIFAGVVILTSCVTRNPEAIGPYPDNYKEIVKAHIERTFFDPYSMRSVSISWPQEGHIFFQQGWIVCLEANAKNRMGGYTGIQRIGYLINNGSVAHSMENPPLCNHVALNPWPEMGSGK